MHGAPDTPFACKHLSSTSDSYGSHQRPFFDRTLHRLTACALAAWLLRYWSDAAFLDVPFLFQGQIGGDRPFACKRSNRNVNHVGQACRLFHTFRSFYTQPSRYSLTALLYHMPNRNAV
jgi:hypothetical protein